MAKPRRPENTEKSVCGRERVKKLERDPNSLQQYHNIIQQQVKEGIMEPAPEGPTDNLVFYLPHHPIIRESAETTKM